MANCKVCGDEIKGRYKEMLANHGYCIEHLPDRLRCGKILASGYPCRWPALDWSYDGYCKFHNDLLTRGHPSDPFYKGPKRKRRWGTKPPEIKAKEEEKRAKRKAEREKQKEQREKQKEPPRDRQREIDVIANIRKLMEWNLRRGQAPAEFDEFFEDSDYHKISITLRDEKTGENLKTFYTRWKPSEIDVLIAKLYDSSDIPPGFFGTFVNVVPPSYPDSATPGKLRSTGATDPYMLYKQQYESPGAPKKRKSLPTQKQQEYQELFWKFSNLYDPKVKSVFTNRRTGNITRVARRMGLGRSKLDRVIGYCYPHFMDCEDIYTGREKLIQEGKQDEEIANLLGVEQDFMNYAVELINRCINDRRIFVTLLHLGKLKRFEGSKYYMTTPKLYNPKNYSLTPEGKVRLEALKNKSDDDNFHRE